MVSEQLSSTRLARLLEGAARVASRTGLRDILDELVQTAMELTGAKYGAMGVLGEHSFLREFVYSGVDQATVEAIGHLPEGRGVLGLITAEAKALRLDRIEDHPDSVGFPPGHPTMETFLGVPIRVGDEVYGNLYLTDRDQPFTPEDQATIEALAVIAGTAISTAELQSRLRHLAVVEDRERIARDLHDAIIQDLFAVGLSLQALSQRSSDDQLRASLSDSVTRLDEAITALRRFIFDLRPSVWGRRNLRHEVTELVESLAGPHAADVSVDFSGEVDDVTERIVEEAVHIVRESVSNALRHAAAENVGVRVARVDQRLRIEVVDDGQGFEPSEPTSGMGLDNLHERAARAGGTAIITSTTGGGATIEVELPL